MTTESSSLSTANEAFVLKPTGQFIYESRNVPALRSTRDVMVRVVATGLCGSDIHYWKHGRIGNYVVETPIVLGHESAGIVVACGAGVKGLTVGDRVALEPGVACNTCNMCRSGRYNLCASMRFAATPPYDGTLSTFYCLPEECCFKLPPRISLREGALVEPLSIAVHCCTLAGNIQGKSVVVFGAGPIGLLCSAVARALGAATVVVVDILESRLAFARGQETCTTYQMGPQSPESNAERLLESTKLSEGADIVIEATGAEPCINCGVYALRRGGIFVQAGLGNPRVPFPIGQICDKEAVLKGSFRYGPGDYQLAIELLRSNRIHLGHLITHEYGFSEAEKAFEGVSNRIGIKTVIYGPGVDKGLAELTVEGPNAPFLSNI